MTTLLGLDLGTSSFKIAAYRDDGGRVATLARPTPWRAGTAGAELVAAEFADVVRELVRDGIAACAGEPVAGIGITAMAETAFVTTARHGILPARAWNGQRLDQPKPPADLFARTGLVAPARATAVTLHQLTAAGQQVQAFAGVAEYAVQVLGGAPVFERSLASRSGLVDVNTGTWSDQLREWAGVINYPLDPIIPAGSPAGELAISGLPAGTVLTVAGHDHVVAAVGAGAWGRQYIFDSLGTGEAIFTIIDDAEPELPGGITRQYAGLGYNISLGLADSERIALAGLGTGNRFNWLLAALTEAGYEHTELVRDNLAAAQYQPAAALPAGAQELLNQLFAADWAKLAGSATARAHAGELAPDLAAARQLWWAAVAHAGQKAAAAVAGLGEIAPAARKIVAAGGWLRNKQIRASWQRALGEIRLPAVAEAGARGAALLAGLAAGVYTDRTQFPEPPETDPSDQTGSTS